MYALDALLAWLWQLWQEAEKPYVVQMDDHVGAEPERGGHPVPASMTGSPPELELPPPDRTPLLLPLLDPEPLLLDPEPLLDPELPLDPAPLLVSEPLLDPEPPLDPELLLDPAPLLFSAPPDPDELLDPE